MRLHLEVEPPRIWYYPIFLNFYTLVILLQVDPTFGDELEIVYDGFYKTKDISTITWSSIPNVEHYHWLRSLIHHFLLIARQIT